MVEILVFNRWSASGIAVADEGLVRYIVLNPKIVPKTGARYAGKRFHKSKKHVKSSGHCTGKTSTVYNIVEKTFGLIEQRIKENPIKVFVQALVNAAPREEIVTIEYGGARYPKAVECAPQRRVDVALRFFVQGAYEKSFNKKKSIEEALAEELIAAYRLDPKSWAISKKNEVERQADASR